ncbi:MAG TPA: FHA domain-containing protein [Solirubrobacteraceae bacterium]
MSTVRLAAGMATRAPSRPTTTGERTESFDGIGCLDERMRAQAMPARQAQTGPHIEVQGPGDTLLIPLTGGVTHIGRGLAADLRLDEASVSRRHAILVHGRSGSRILDDRSSNGTFVNGHRVTQAHLHNGDVFLLGRVALRYLEL